MKKLYYILAVVLIVCGTLSGCKKNPGTPEDNAVVENGGEEEESGYRFGYNTVDLDSPYFQTMKKSLAAALGKENGELLVKDAQYDAQLQNSQIQELIEEEVDAVFVTPVDSETIAPALEELKKAGIPVINLDTKVKDGSLADAYIGADNKNAGYVCGEDLLKQCPGGGKIILMENPLIHAMNERVTGFERAIANEGFEVLSRAQVQGDRQQAKEKNAGITGGISPD